MADINSKELNDAQFQQFQHMLKDSVNKTLHNFIAVFTFINMYEQSTEENKKVLHQFIEAMREEVRSTHVIRAENMFDLTAIQKETFNKDIDSILTGCLAPILSKMPKKV